MLLACLILAALIVPFNPQIRTVVSAGGGGASFSDNFDRADGDSLGSNWTEAAGDFDIASNRLDPTTASFAEVVVAYTGTACNTVNQYVKITFVGPADRYPGIVFRYTNASSPMYGVYFWVDENKAEWVRKATASDGAFTTVEASGTVTITATDTWGCTITGTGTSTVIRCWLNPTGNAPDSATSWGGDTTPEISFTADPASAVNTGNNVGLMCEQSAATDLGFDNFFGGDIP